jgi:adenylate cyclase
MKNPFLPLINRFAPVGDGHSFEFLLERETLSSEIRRARLLIGGFGIVALFYASAMKLADSYLGTLLNHQTWKPLAGMLLFMGYELAFHTALSYVRRSNRHLPFFVRFGNAIVETSFLSAEISIIAAASTPAFGLASPPAYGYFIFIILATMRMDFNLALFTGLVTAVEYGLMILFYSPVLLADRHTFWLAILAPYWVRCGAAVVGGLAAGFVASELRHQFQHSLDLMEERNRINRVFGQFVSPQVREKLLNQQLNDQGEMRQVCLMFLDIRDFTHFAEGRSPQEVVRFLNTLFEFMVESVTQQHGIINKFLGDGFMAVFGAPLTDDQHIQHAVTASLDILSQLDKLNAAAAIPPTRIGIGLHAGEAVTGAIGTSQRKEYTIIGDTVNLAARLEELNKTYCSRLLVSEAVWLGLQHDLRPSTAQDLGEVIIRGRAAPVRVYRLD